MKVTPQADELRALALQALLAPDPQQKVAEVQSIHARLATISIAPDTLFDTPAGLPGCPARPELRSHLQIPKRSPFTPEGLAALLHAVTHIEFNAINLASESSYFSHCETTPLFSSWSTLESKRNSTRSNRPRLSRHWVLIVENVDGLAVVRA